MPDKLILYALVGAGSALGGVGRVWLSALAAQRWGEAFPWGTLLVNVSGSFVIGVFAGLTGAEGRWAWGERGTYFFTAGVCGGFTTFSAFSLQTLRLAQAGQGGLALANAVASVGLCLLAVWAGHWVGR